MDMFDDRRVVIQPLNKFWYLNKVDSIDMLRLDLLHPVVSGNKWYKLRLNMNYALDNGFKTIVTNLKRTFISGWPLANSMNSAQNANFMRKFWISKPSK